MGAKMMTTKAYKEFVNLSDELNRVIRPRTRFRYVRTADLIAEMQELLIQPDTWQAWTVRQEHKQR